MDETSRSETFRRLNVMCWHKVVQAGRRESVVVVARRDIYDLYLCLEVHGVTTRRHGDGEQHGRVKDDP